VPEQNKVAVRRYFEDLWGRGNLAVADAILSTDLFFHGPGVGIRGAESFKQFVAAFRASFPDLEFTDLESIAEGARVASCFTMRGTQRAEFQGIPPTGRQVRVQGTHMFRFANHAITEIRINMDTLGMLQQLGILPGPGDEIPAPIR
jgi:steroid delta-isomerase-like uncharacterized protein